MTIEKAINTIIHFCDHIRPCDEYGYLIDKDLCDAHQMAVRALMNQKWIPVTERLSEKSGTYIVFTKSGCVTTARWYSERDFVNYRGEFIRHEEGRFHRNATHWMSLPEPPQEDI